MADQILNGKYILELDELTSIVLADWLTFQPNTVIDQAYRISLTNFIKALPIIPAVAGEYANVAAMLAAQSGQTADVFYKVADPSDDPDYNDLKDSEIKSVYYHLVDAKTGSLSNYNSIAIPKLESDKNAKLGNSLEALTFDVKFRSAEWSSNEATLQAIANALKVSSPQDLLLDALSVKLNTDNNPTDISRVLFGVDGQLIFEPIDSSKIQSDSDAGDVTLNDSYQLLLTITSNQNIANGLANIGLTAKSFSTAAITAFAASGNNRVRATSAAHGFSEGDYVEIVNTANYDGIYEIKAVPNINDFDFTTVFVATETGDWEKSENREIAVDLRVNAISAKEFTRQIEGEGRLNFSEQLSGVASGEDIDVYVKSNTAGEAIEILGTTQISEVKAISSDKNEPNTWHVNTNGDDANDGSSEKPFETIQKALDSAVDKDVIILMNSFHTYNENVTFVTGKELITITGISDSDAEITGTWTFTSTNTRRLRLEKLLVNITISTDALTVVTLNNCTFNPNNLDGSRLIALILNETILQSGTTSNLYWLKATNSNIITSTIINAGRQVELYGTSVVGDIVAGLDASITCILKNSSITGDLTVTGNLEKENATIGGDETVSGTTTFISQIDKIKVPNTWYVNTDGSDSNVGSDKFPFETIQAAHDAASANDTIIIQNSNFLQPITPNTNITKDALTIRGVSSETNNQGRLRGIYNITGGLTLMIDLLSTIDVTFQGGSLYIVQLSNGYHDGVTSTTTNLKLIVKNALVYLNDPISLYSLDSYNSTVNGDINSGRSGYFEASFYEGDWIGGIDATSNIVLHNSTIKGNVTQTGSLEKDNSVITGTETVSGTPTSRQAKVFDDSVEFKDKVSIGVATFLNSLDVAGGMAVGSSYAGIFTAPTDGMIIEGFVAIGKSSAPSATLDVNGPIKATSFIQATSMTLHSTLGMYQNSNTNNRIRTRQNEQIDMISAVSDGASAVAYDLNTLNALSNASAKLLTLRNNSVDKFIIDKDGNVISLQSPEPPDPPDGTSIKWTHDGSGGTYGQGDVVEKSTFGTTKVQILLDWSAL